MITNIIRKLSQSRILLPIFSFLGITAFDLSAFGSSDFQVAKDILYQQPQGWAENLSKLDMYYTDTQGSKPVVVLIHGSGVSPSDKSNMMRNPEMVRFFIRHGFIVAAVNYRLLNDEHSLFPNYKDQVTDVARALKWLSSNASRYGGRESGFVVLGYSWGSHMAALLGTDERYLSAEGLNLDSLAGVIAMCNFTYDLPLGLKLLKGTSFEGIIKKLKHIYGQSVAEQLQASPAHYLNNIRIKPFLILSQGLKNGKSTKFSGIASASFQKELVRNGHSAWHFDFPDRSHASIPGKFGSEGDTPTKAVLEFIHKL